MNNLAVLSPVISVNSMESLTVVTPAISAQKFDFERNKVETMSLETLMKTQRENDVQGKPLRGMYHFQVIQQIAAMCQKYNLNYEVEEIFAAHNNNKNFPGSTIIKDLELTYGEKSVESHILRRVFTTVRIKDFDTDELTTTLAIAYHQDGIQAAIGPNVKICHNQCILSPQRSVSNYGKNKVSTDELFNTVDGWLSNFETDMNEDRARISAMKSKIVSEQEIYIYIGLLTAIRVAHDSSVKELSSKVSTYPLNQSQISIFTEEVLKLMQKKEQITAWDLYNVATEIYKPDRAEIPALIPQNVAFASKLSEFCMGEMIIS